MLQPRQLGLERPPQVVPFRKPLLKWVGSKQRFAHEIAGYFPFEFGTYFEPFVGSGAVLGTLRPERAVATDSFAPLIEIWKTLHKTPDTIKRWYEERWRSVASGDKIVGYERIKASYNTNPNGADMLFLSRSCYGGVVRFRKSDGYMSTPCGVHTPISPDTFGERVDEWFARTRGTEFEVMEFEQAMSIARHGDLIYCDPPYTYTQSILYGAQSFSLQRLLEVIADCKDRGVFVALSIDGSKRSGNFVCDLPIPSGLFEREVSVNVGRSMLRRFQMKGESLEGELVADRLLLTH